MTLFMIIKIAYHIFFAGLFVLSGIVYSKLKKVSEKISKKELDEA